MINNRNPASSTPKNLPFPLHRLNTPQVKMWLASESWRREHAARLAEKYRGGVGVLSPTMYLFVVVDPRGVITERQPPYHRFEMHQIDNQPEPERCPCGDYFDPEARGPWRLRPEFERGEHHPLCQFDPFSKRTFYRAAVMANDRLDRGEENPQERPDEWLKIREAARAG
jgi:hypothetical protein